mgnify:CR=1 FL=1
MSCHKIIAKELLLLGFSPDHSGYRYIISGLDMSFDDETLLLGITYILYPAIAQKYDVSPSSVERSIRFAIQSAWKKGNLLQWQKYFGHDCQRPGNARFIATMHEMLNVEEIEQYTLF